MLNSKGGIAGHQVKLIVDNDQANPTIAENQAQQLVSSGVAAILTPGTEVTSSVTIPIFQKAKVPVLFNLPDDSWSDGTKWPYFFATGWSTNDNAKALVQYAKANGAKAVGLASDNTGFGLAFEQDVQKEAAAQGLKIVKTVNWSETVVDLTTTMQELRAAGADSIIIGGGVGYQQAFTALTTLGWKPSIYGYTAIYELPSFGGLEGTPLATNAFATCGSYCLASGTKPPESLVTLVNDIKAKIGNVPDIASSVVFNEDDLLILKYTIQKSHTLSGPALRDAIQTIHNQSFTLPTDKYTFTATQHRGLHTPDPIGAIALGFNPQGFPYIAPQP